MPQNNMDHLHLQQELERRKLKIDQQIEWCDAMLIVLIGGPLIGGLGVGIVLWLSGALK